MYSQTESYLEELFRPQDQKNFIKDVKNKYKRLQAYHWEIKALLGEPANYIFDEVNTFYERMDGEFKRAAAEFGEEWGRLNSDHWWESEKVRKDLFRKHKMHITAIIKNKMGKINRNLPKIKKVMNQYIKEQPELQQFIDDHKEIYDKIKTRWYNIFGGPKQYIKNRGDWSAAQAQAYMRFMKMNPGKIASDYLCIRFIMGVDKNPNSEVAKLLFGGGFEHRHDLMSY